MTPQDLGALFEHFERSAFRLETHDRYDVEDEADRLAAFREGRPLPIRTPENNEWLALVSTATTSGRTIGRVRILGRPLTEYSRFEFAVYPENIAAGEKIRIRERRMLTVADDEWSHQDFWLFDDQTAVLLHYDQQDRFVGVELAADIAPYLAARRGALARSIDFKDFSLELTPLER
jgi:hypothetical protein